MNIPKRPPNRTQVQNAAHSGKARFVSISQLQESFACFPPKRLPSLKQQAHTFSQLFLPRQHHGVISTILRVLEGQEPSNKYNIYIYMFNTLKITLRNRLFISKKKNENQLLSEREQQKPPDPTQAPRRLRERSRRAPRHCRAPLGVPRAPRSPAAWIDPDVAREATVGG